MPDLFSQIYGAAPAGDDLFSSIYGDAAPPPAEHSLLQPIKTAVSSTFEVLNRPSRAVAETALALKHGEAVLPGVERALKGESHASMEDLLAEEGMQPGLKRTLAGLAADIATDPLNLVGGLPFKAVKALDKLPLVAKAEQAVKDIPLVESVGKRFVPYFGLPEKYADARRLLDSEVAARRGEAFEQSLERYHKINPEEAKQITLALDKPAGSTGVEKLDRLAEEQRAAFAAQRDKEIAAKVLDPNKAVENYVTYLFKNPETGGTNVPLTRKLSAKNPFGKTRDLKSIEQALYLGAEPHIARIAAVRQATGDRAIAVANFFKKAVDDFSLPLEHAPQGFREVSVAGDMPIKEIFKGRAFDPAVAEDLEKLSRPQEARDALDNAFRVATGVWKGYATAANPGFHFRNLVSNLFNSWLGGMNPGLMPIRYAEAGAAAAGKLRGIGKFSPEEIAQAMKDLGVVGTGHGAFGEVHSALDLLTNKTNPVLSRAISAANPFSRFNAIQSGGRHVGQAVEDLSRRALFLDQLHKGKSLEDAALHVKKYLFDYGELTDFEKQIRDYAVPFYTWLRKNLPLQIEGLLSQPEKYAHTGKVLGKLEDATTQAGLSIPRGERPEWAQKQDLVQLPTTTSKGERLLLNPDLPFQDLDYLPVDAASHGKLGQAATDTFNSLLSMTNPAVKVPIELALNREAYTGGEIVPEELGPDALIKAPGHMAMLAEAAPKLAEELGMQKSLDRYGREQWVMPARAVYLANQLPFFSKLGKIASPMETERQGTVEVPGLASILRLYPGKKGVLEPRAVSYLGFGLTPLDPTRQAIDVARRLKENTRQTRAGFRQGARQIPTTPSDVDQILQLVLGGGI